MRAALARRRAPAVCRRRRHTALSASPAQSSTPATGHLGAAHYAAPVSHRRLPPLHASRSTTTNRSTGARPLSQTRRTCTPPPAPCRRRATASLTLSGCRRIPRTPGRRPPAPTPGRRPARIPERRPPARTAGRRPPAPTLGRRPPAPTPERRPARTRCRRRRGVPCSRRLQRRRVTVHTAALSWHARRRPTSLRPPTRPATTHSPTST